MTIWDCQKALTVFAFAGTWTFGFALAQDAETPLEMTEVQACLYLELGPSFPSAFVNKLGPWESCKRTVYERSEDGITQTLIVMWPNVTMTVDYHPPETGIYIIETTGQSPLDEKWFDGNHDEIIDSGFEMNWSRDEFLGPTGEYYISRDPGSNAQLWLERGPSKEITWLRFSYAL